MYFLTVIVCVCLQENITYMYLHVGNNGSDQPVYSSSLFNALAHWKVLNTKHSKF